MLNNKHFQNLINSTSDLSRYKEIVQKWVDSDMKTYVQSELNRMSSLSPEMRNYIDKYNNGMTQLGHIKRDPNNITVKNLIDSGVKERAYKLDTTVGLWKTKLDNEFNKAKSSIVENPENHEETIKNYDNEIIKTKNLAEADIYLKIKDFNKEKRITDFCDQLKNEYNKLKSILTYHTSYERKDGPVNLIISNSYFDLSTKNTLYPKDTLGWYIRNPKNEYHYFNQWQSYSDHQINGDTIRAGFVKWKQNNVYDVNPDRSLKSGDFHMLECCQSTLNDVMEWMPWIMRMDGRIEDYFQVNLMARVNKRNEDIPDSYTLSTNNGIQRERKNIDLADGFTLLKLEKTGTQTNKDVYNNKNIEISNIRSSLKQKVCYGNKLFTSPEPDFVVHRGLKNGFIVEMKCVKSSNSINDKSPVTQYNFDDLLEVIMDSVGCQTPRFDSKSSNNFTDYTRQLIICENPLALLTCLYQNNYSFNGFIWCGKKNSEPRAQGGFLYGRILNVWENR